MPRKGASSHRRKSSKLTLNINQKIKKNEEEKKLQFADDQQQIGSIQKEVKGFWEYLRS